MIRLEITDEDLEVLKRLRRSTLKPSEQDRVEMLLLHREGWSASCIARFFGR